MIPFLTLPQISIVQIRAALAICDLSEDHIAELQLTHCWTQGMNEKETFTVVSQQNKKET
jgi:hypothetical protein